MTDFISRKRIEFELCESNMPFRYRDFCRRVINNEDLSPSIELKPLLHAYWKTDEDNHDGWIHHICSNCKQSALYYPIFSEDYDEDIDGEWVTLGMMQNDIDEFLTDYCPYCGAKMNGVSE